MSSNDPVGRYPDYQPGAHRDAVARWTPAVEYGGAGETNHPGIEWEPAAEERMKKVPAFVRGMVVRRVEGWCRDNGVRRVTVEQLERIRAKMPTPKVFGRGR